VQQTFGLFKIVNLLFPNFF